MGGVDEEEVMGGGGGVGGRGGGDGWMNEEEEEEVRLEYSSRQHLSWRAYVDTGRAGSKRGESSERVPRQPGHTGPVTPLQQRPARLVVRLRRVLTAGKRQQVQG
jgi:hypothetical protein